METIEKNKLCKIKWIFCVKVGIIGCASQRVNPWKTSGCLSWKKELAYER